MNCPVCQIKTSNPKFCSRSCAAKLNNHKHPKRKRGSSLCCCGELKTHNSKLCRTCFYETKFIEYGKKSLQDLINESKNYASKHKYEKIRQHAKRIAKQLNWYKDCEFCGYSKHVEICHKKPICSFSKTTLIEEINSKNNLLFLCPNCHWEYDNLK
jgi:hypothetical protein